MFINQIIWSFSPAAKSSTSMVQSENILLYYGFNKLFTEQYKPWKSHMNGTLAHTKKKYGQDEYERRLKQGQQVSSMWDDICSSRTVQVGMVGYPTQKPKKLLRRIICLSTK